MDGLKYDVFLSHQSGDKPAVEELARLLKRRKIKPWLDAWDLAGGDSWQKEIEKVLEGCASMVVCFGPGDIGPWQELEMEAALIRRAKEPSFRIIPILLPGVEQGVESRVPFFLKGTMWVEFRERLDDKEMLRRLARSIRGEKPGAGPAIVVSEGAAPYLGLKAFDMDAAAFFFGREALLERLLDKLRPPHLENRFLAVIGPSGSGKSSLAQAGLLDALKKGRLPGSDTWPAAVCRPGTQPLESLAMALAGPAGLAGSPVAVQELTRNLGKDTCLLHVTTRLALRDSPAERRFIVLIDQFEEVFTLCSDEGQRWALVDNLLHAATEAAGRTVVLLTLRADFYVLCAAHPGLAAALSDRQVLVGPMSQEELRHAIERPAALAHCELEPGLTDLLLKDTKGQQGSLPLLQHALLTLWEKCKRWRRLTIEAYLAIGGVSGALEQHAEGVYEAFTDTEKEACRRVLLELVQPPGEGMVATRRRLALNELETAGREGIGTIVRCLADARLLTTDGKENPTVELAHEALITGWKQFEKWIESAREALLARRRLDDSAAEWIANGRDPSYLYREGRLAQAEEWDARWPGELSRSGRELLDTSLAQRDEEDRRELARLEEERRRELAQRDEEHRRELAHRDEERRRELIHARQLRFLSYGLAAGLVLAVTAAGFAFAEWMKSEQQRRVLLARNLAQRVRSVLPSNPPLGVLLAAEAVKFRDRLDETDQIEEEEALRRALSQSFGRALESGRVNAVGTTPDRRFLVTAGVDRTARLWDLNAKDPAISGRPLVRLDEGTVSALTLTNDLRWLLTRATESAKARVFLRDLTSKDGPRELPEEDWLDARQPFSPDGRWLVTHQTGKGLLRDLRTHTVRPLGIRDLRVAVYSRDGRWLATAFTGGPAGLRDLRSADPAIQVHKLPGIGERTVSLEFAPDGRQITAVDEDKTQVTWDLDPTGRPGVPVKADFKGSIELLRFPPEVRDILGLVGPRRFGSHSPDGRWIITQGGKEPPRLRDNPKVLVEVEPVRSGYSWDRLLAISGNGQFLLASRGDQVFLLDLKDRGREIEIHGNGPFSRWTLGFDGSWIAGAAAYRLFVWHRTPEGFRTVLKAERPGSFWMLALSPNNRWLASGGRTGISPLLWSLRDPKAEPIELTRHSGGVTALAFDPQGRWLATGGREGIVRRYDLGVSQPNVQSVRESEESGPGSWITALAFSPDGAWIAVADRAGRIVLWKSGARERLLGNRTDAIRSLAFSPDGRSLAGVSESGAAQLWRLEEDLNMVEPVLLTEPKSVHALAFSSDSRLITDGPNSQVRRWETRLDELLKIACRTVGRNLTPEEWETHLPGEPYDPLEPCPNLPPGE